MANIGDIIRFNSSIMDRDDPEYEECKRNGSGKIVFLDDVNEDPLCILVELDPSSDPGLGWDKGGENEDCSWYKYTKYGRLYWWIEEREITKYIYSSCKTMETE